MSALKIGSLFSGVGGLDLAVEQFFDAETAWHCEFDPEPSKVLAARWPGVPNLGDITAVDWSQVEPVDILCGGFPCQDLSLAGRRAGMRPGTRSGLWSDFVKAIDALRPSVVVVENVRGLLSGCAESESDSVLGRCPRCVDPKSGVSHAPNLRALGRVLGDLHYLGFDAEWTGLRASEIGAPHGRFRVFVLAYARGVRLGAWRNTAPGAETRGRASTVVGGRGGAPVGRLFSTPDTVPEAPNTGSNSHKAGNVVGLGNQVRSLLPTPVTTDGGSNSPGDKARRSPGLRTRPTLFRTPTAAELEGGRRDPDRPGATMRLRDLIAEEQERGILLPTPVAQPSGDTPAEHLRKKVENGLLETGGRLLPTPKAGDSEFASPSTTGRPVEMSTHLSTIAMLVDGHLEHRRTLPTPRASRGAAATETMYALGAERDDTGDRQGNVVLLPTPRAAASRSSRSTMLGPSASSMSIEQAVEVAQGVLPREFETWEEVGVQPGDGIHWGDYEPAVRLWEQITRPAPAPTLPVGKNGNHRLAAVFPEWMLGFDAGWITDVLGRNPSIKAVGNSVCPPQAFAALGVLWPRVLEAVAA